MVMKLSLQSEVWFAESLCSALGFQTLSLSSASFNDEVEDTMAVFIEKCSTSRQTKFLCYSIEPGTNNTHRILG